jgi:hypothetical protein
VTLNAMAPWTAPMPPSSSRTSAATGFKTPARHAPGHRMGWLPPYCVSRQGPYPASRLCSQCAAAALLSTLDMCMISVVTLF